MVEGAGGFTTADTALAVVKQSLCLTMSSNEAVHIEKLFYILHRLKPMEMFMCKICPLKTVRFGK